MPYKSLTEFKNDTTAFILYNFMDRAEQYKGKKLEDISRDLQIPITRISSDQNSPKEIRPIYIYIWNQDYLRKRRPKKLYVDFLSIKIEWEKSEFDIQKYLQMYMADIPVKMNFYNQFVIKNINVIIPEKSKYYEKYKPKETKSVVDRPRGLVRDENGELVSRVVIIDR